MNEIFALKNVSLTYGKNAVTKKIDLRFFENRITCIIGPSGTGKSTLLRTLNRMNDLYPSFRHSGEVLFEDKDIYKNGINVEEFRQKVGMVFQKPCIFPKSIFENVIFGVKHLKLNNKDEFPGIVEASLKTVSLWDEVKDRLDDRCTELSQGQQQRLTIARALAISPKVLLLDEPTSALDYRSARAIENMIVALKSRITIIMVTHKLDQVKRIADDVVFMCDGEVCESGTAEKVLENSQRIETKCYINEE